MFAKPSCDNVLLTSLLPGLGCNTYHRYTKTCDGHNACDGIVTGFVDTLTAMSLVVVGHLLGCQRLSQALLKLSRECPRNVSAIYGDITGT